MRQRWIYKDGEAHEVSDDYVPEPRGPFIMGDIQPYKSMVDGSLIGSRSTHRAHLKAHGMIEVGDQTHHLKPKQKAPPPGLKETIIRLANEKLR